MGSKEYQKQWRENHKAELAEYQKKYQAERKAEIAEQKRAYYLANREEFIARAREHYEKNPQPVIDRAKKWNAENRPASNASKRKWAKGNPEVGRESARRYRERHPEYHKKRLAEWAKRNPILIRLKNHNRRLQIKGTGTITVAEVEALYDRQNGKCAACEKKVGTKYHLDHVMPLSLGGEHKIENAQILCPPCNQKKHAMHPDDWARRIGKLFI